MQTRVLVGQPWDVAADVIALPVVKDERSTPWLAEIDRRLDGALTAYRTLGELKGSPWTSSLLRTAEMGAPWLLAMGVGETAAFDRLTAHRLGAAVERRLSERREGDRKAAFVTFLQRIGEDGDSICSPLLDAGDERVDRIEVGGEQVRPIEDDADGGSRRVSIASVVDADSRLLNRWLKSEPAQQDVIGDEAEHLLHVSRAAKL